MESYQITATVNELGSLVIPAPVKKVGTRLRLLVTWEEDAIKYKPGPNRKDALRKLRGCLKNYSVMNSDEWNLHKHEIWG